MDPKAQFPQASNEEIQAAKDLLQNSGLSSPHTRFLCETLIASKSQQAIDKVNELLKAYIQKKEAAYKKYKQQVGSGFKQEILNQLKKQAPSS